MISKLFSALILISAIFTKAAAEPLELEAVSFNIRYLTSVDKGERHWNTRKELVAETVRHFKTDILGIQEAFKTQLDYILTSAPGFSMIGAGRDDGKERGEYSAILFRSDRFDADPNDQGTFWLSDTPETAGSRSWGNNVVRICTWARLIDKKTGRGFYVFNTHFDHESQPSREQAAKLITRRIESRKSPADPFILMGDFNATEQNPAILHILGQGYIDTFRAKNADTPESLTIHQWKGGTKGPKIDYLFVQPETEVLKSSIDRFHKDDLYPSDHYPVRASLRFKG